MHIIRPSPIGDSDDADDDDDDDDDDPINCGHVTHLQPKKINDQTSTSITGDPQLYTVELKTTCAMLRNAPCFFARLRIKRTISRQFWKMQLVKPK